MITMLNDGSKKGINVSLHLFRSVHNLFIIENIFFINFYIFVTHAQKNIFTHSYMVTFHIYIYKNYFVFFFVKIINKCPLYANAWNAIIIYNQASKTVLYHQLI